MAENEHVEFVIELERIMDMVLNGDPVTSFDEELIKKELGIDFAYKLKELLNNINESQKFAYELSTGNIDSTPPARNNNIAGSLKQLHMQLSSLSYGLEQLSKGKIVSKLYYHGTLFEQFNNVVSYIANKNLDNKDALAQEYKDNNWLGYQSLAAVNELKTMIIQVALDGYIFFANKSALKYVKGRKHFTSSDAFIMNDPVLRYLYDFQHEKHVATTTATIYDEKKSKWYSVKSDFGIFINEIEGYTHTIDDITEQKQHELNMMEEMEMDSLTGIYNRRAGLKALGEAMEYVKTGMPACAAFLDIDGLKFVNDTYGHTEGDYMIRTIAQALMLSVLSSDVASRYGGDEFLIVFPNCKLQDAKNAIERTKSVLAHCAHEDHKPYNIGFSTGIISLNTLSSVHQGSLESIIKYIDGLMYEEKRKRHACRSQEARF